LNPFEIHRIFKFEFVLKFISSFPLGIRSLRIVGAKEGIHFEFTYSSYFWKIGKIPNHTAQLLAPVFGPRCSDRAPSVQTAATVICHGPWFLSSLPVIAAYKGSMWPRGEPLSQFTSSSLRPRSLLDANDVRHLRPPPSPSEPTQRTTVSSSSCGTRLQPKSPVSDAGSRHSPPSSSSARAHHRELLSVLLQPNQEYHELPFILCCSPT
jgi:hypothetical protein